MSFSLKKTVKAVEKKVVAPVAKVAIAPAAFTAAASLNSIGLRGAANKVIDKTAFNKKFASSEKKAATAAGWAIDAGAVAVAGVAAAPAISSAGASLGHGALAAGGLLKGAAGKVAPFLGGLLGKRAPATAASDENTGAPGAQAGDLLNKVKSFGTKFKQASSYLRKHAGPQGTSDAGENTAADDVHQASVTSLGGLPSWAPIAAIAAFLIFEVLSKKKGR